MQIRRGRVTHPIACSQAPRWETGHLMGKNSMAQGASDAVRQDSLRPMADAFHPATGVPLARAAQVPSPLRG